MMESLVIVGCRSLIAFLDESFIKGICIRLGMKYQHKFNEIHQNYLKKTRFEFEFSSFWLDFGDFVK